MRRSFASVAKKKSDGYIAIAGMTSATKSATSRAACDARRECRVSHSNAAAQTPAVATAMPHGRTGIESSFT